MELQKTRYICIVVATHKVYRMPTDAMYLLVQAGAAGAKALPYQSDAEGDNISEKNPYYCELTCLYWAWKNLQADYVGLCHYRRYFAGSRLGNKWTRLLSGKEAEDLLKTVPVLLPKPRHYFIETNYSQYAHAHNGKDLDMARAVIEEKYPGYTAAFDRVMGRTSGHHFNMFVMRRDILDAYCSWLFDILFTLEPRIDTTGYDVYNKRVFGFIGERLLDVWLETNRVAYKELPVLNMESQHWPKKIALFLYRKLKGKPAVHEATAE